MPIFSNSLPRYKGKYSVATTDLELPTTQSPPQHFGTALLATTREPALVLDTVLFTLFYPTVPTKGRTPHQPWLERPLSRTVSGYAKFTSQSKWLLLPVFWLIAGGTQLPASVDTALADKIAEMRESSRSSEATIGGEGGEDDAFSLVIFSHGLGSNRTTYSQYCGELASHGYIVAALEHRDGSGPTSTIYTSPSTPLRTIEYLLPSDLYFAPPNPELSQIAFRKEQLLMRQAEVEAALGVLERINAGRGEEVGRENRRRGNVSWKGWEGRISMKEPVMAGHSFGGATTLQVLRAGKCYPFHRGIALDPWVDPIPPITSTSSSASPTADPPHKVGTDISVPLLVLNSEAFTLWHAHYLSVRAIVRGVKEDAASWLATLVGSVHLSFSDFPLIAPFVAKRSGGRVDAKVAMDVFVQASLEFLSGEEGGKWLGQEVREGDEEGTRDGEGYAKEGKKPMEKVGELRMHVRPKL